MGRLAKKVVLITGSSSGIGRSIALTFAAEDTAFIVCADLKPDPPAGATGDLVSTVAITDLGDASTEKTTTVDTDQVPVGTETAAGSSEQDGSSTQPASTANKTADAKASEAQGTKESPDDQKATHDLINSRFGEGKAAFIKVDVREEKEVEAAVALAVEKGGRLDVLVNNAGVGLWGEPIQAMSLDKFKGSFEVGVYGAFLGCKYAITQFLKQDLDSNGHRGWIINMASVAGMVGLPNAAGYCASKGAIVNLTRSLAIETAGQMIHVNALCPAHVRTPMTAHLFADPNYSMWMQSIQPMWRNGVVEDVSRAAVFLASDDAAVVTGILLPVDGGASAQ